MCIKVGWWNNSILWITVEKISNCVTDFIQKNFTKVLWSPGRGTFIVFCKLGFVTNLCGWNSELKDISWCKSPTSDNKKLRNLDKLRIKYASLYASMLHYMSVRFIICHYASLYISMLHYMPLCFIICQYASLHGIMLHYMSVWLKILVYN